MQIIRDIETMRVFAHEHGANTGFVPTMGYLHEGHMSLVRRARSENQIVVVSIFVNPAQFNDPKDFDKYPIDIERDTRMLEGEAVDAVFLPQAHDVYPHGVPALRMTYPELMSKLCGRFRPGHFEGVLLIVHNLFEWVRPRRAYFGLKDYQQYLLIRRMAKDLELGVEVIGCPLVREKSGLAMSSRNVRLTASETEAALKISAALGAIARKVRAEAAPHLLQAELVARLEPLKVEYAEICDPETLETLTDWSRGNILIAVAAYVGAVRLIDNAII